MASELPIRRLLPPLHELPVDLDQSYDSGPTPIFEVRSRLEDDSPPPPPRLHLRKWPRFPVLGGPKVLVEPRLVDESRYDHLGQSAVAVAALAVAMMDAAAGLATEPSVVSHPHHFPTSLMTADRPRPGPGPFLLDPAVQKKSG